jgi:cation diffusion facilitator family transporter
MKRNFGLAVAFTGAAVNLMLFLVKLYVAVSCKSLSIYLDSLNNAADSLVCVAVGFGFILVNKSADKNYPFGFGKTEGVVNFVISSIILFAGLSFAYASLNRLMYPIPVSFTTKYALVIALTVPTKLLLLLFYKWASKKQPSAVFGSLGLDSLLDFFITLCSLSAFVFSDKTDLNIDGIAGMIISVILIIQGVKIVKESFGELIGKRDNALCERIEKSVIRVDGVNAVKDVRCHIYGKKAVANITLCTENGVVSEELIQKIKNEINDEFVCEIYVNIGG